MRAPLPTTLPDSLADYLPGRVVVVPASDWSVPDSDASTGVRTALPRYGLELRTLDVPIDEQRVRWLTDRATVRPLDTRLVDVVHHRGVLHVVGGHHTLAAHLITGAERVPVRLGRAPRATSTAVQTGPPVAVEQPAAALA
jgi:hypothetical protein